MTPKELLDHIEGAQELRKDYAGRIAEIDRDIAGMKANYLRMIRETPIIVGS